MREVAFATKDKLFPVFRRKGTKCQAWVRPERSRPLELRKYGPGTNDTDTGISKKLRYNETKGQAAVPCLPKMAGWASNQGENKEFTAS